VGLSSRLFCRKIFINKPDLLKAKGPVLLAANHPDSFLDAVILDILFDQPIWSLARGDVFKNPFYIRLLTMLKILPVYRTSEGVENLETNYKTFDDCKELFKKKAIVLMFSEGKCVNEWHLRPLRKGTARLAISSWKDDIHVKVLPVGINYSSFYRFGKNVWLNFGELITINEFDLTETDGKLNLAFNQKLQDQLEQLVFEIDSNDKKAQEQQLAVQPGIFKRITLLLPAIAGFIFHIPYYLPLKLFSKKRTTGTGHYDSVIIALVTLLYPFYVLLFSFLMVWFFHSWSFLGSILVLPFTAWSYIQLKGQLDK